MKRFLKKNIGFIIFYIVLIVIIIVYMKYFRAVKKYEIVDSLNDLPYPTQIATTGGFSQKMATGTNINEKIKVSYLYEFEVWGKVVNTQDYYGFANFADAISKRDITVVYGPLNDDEVLKNITFSSTASRAVYYSFKVRDVATVRKLKGMADLYLSNIHAIHSNYKIEKLLQMVKVNDYIRMKGYLVNVDSESGGYWHSKIPINGKGELQSHECQVMYVTELVWLKEK